MTASLETRMHSWNNLPPLFSPISAPTCLILFLQGLSEPASRTNYWAFFILPMFGGIYLSPSMLSAISGLEKGPKRPTFSPLPHFYYDAPIPPVFCMKCRGEAAIINLIKNSEGRR